MTSGPLIASCHADEWDRLLARVEAGGNDGADVYEAQEFCEWILQRYGEDIETLIERLKTYIMQRMGDAWDPERFCPYTGRPIFPHPYFQAVGPNNGPASWRVCYWRDDGEAMRCREATPAEVARIGANMAETVRLENAFRQWLEAVRKKD